MKLIKYVLVVLGIAMLSALSSGAIANAQSGPASAACQGVGFTNGTACGDNGTQLHNGIVLAGNILSVIVGVIAAIMIMISGLPNITSGGEAGKIPKVTTTLIYAMGGIVL